METKESILRRVFGYAAFRGGQETLIDGELAGRDVFGVMPTGGGKSLCYQIPALLLPGVTLVISPLISLMHDQVMALKNAGVAAAYVNSSLTVQQIRLVYRNIRAGMYKIIYVAPERLLTDGFLETVQSCRVSMVTVDEAHCISQWGQDFRPSYLKIVDFLKLLPVRPVVSAFTATATERVRQDVEETLGLQNPLRVITGFDRPNLRFEVRRPPKKPDAILELVGQRRGRSGIIYCSTRKNVEKVCELLCAHGFPATRYHAGLSDQERHDNQEDFLYDRAPIMVATNAFGMGIDKSNVSYVIHYNMPQSLENYYQEAGRAGRDGAAAECILLYSAGDVETARFLILHPSGPEEEPASQEQVQRDLVRLDQMVEYCKTQGCLRGYILDYFGQSHAERCGNCGNCDLELEERDITAEARVILDCAAHIRQQLGYSLGLVALRRVLLGSRESRVLQLRLDRLPEYGALHRVGKTALGQMMEALLAQGYLYADPEHRAVSPTEKAAPVLRGEQAVSMQVEAERKTKKTAVRTGTPAQPVDEALYTALKNLRFRLARQEHMPAYIVFSNATLEDMARRHPQNLEEFLQVSGVGSTKAQRYADAFLAEIHRYDSETEPSAN